MLQTAEAPQRAGAGLQVGSSQDGEDAGRLGVLQVVGHRTPHLLDLDDRGPFKGEDPGPDVARSVRGSESRSAGRCPGSHHRVGEVGHRIARRGDTLPDARLRLLVGGEVRMYVEVVGSEVQPDGRRRREAGGMAQPERRGLHDEHVGVDVIDGCNQRSVRIAGRYGHQAGPLQHVGHQGDHGRLAVGSRHGAPGPGVPARREVRLVQDLDARSGGGGEDRVPVRYPRRHDHLPRPFQQRPPVLRKGRFDKLHRKALRTGPRFPPGPIINAESLQATAGKGIQDRPARDPQAQHEDRSAHPPTAPEAIESA